MPALQPRSGSTPNPGAIFLPADSPVARTLRRQPTLNGLAIPNRNPLTVTRRATFRAALAALLASCLPRLAFVAAEAPHYFFWLGAAG
jgi:hypothetical protein